jgi:hypothetical protein
VREKIEELRNKGGAQNLSRANMLARTFGIDEDALIGGRLGIFKKAFNEQLKRNSDIAAEKAVALTRAYNALAAALEAVARKADAALFDKIGAVLDRLTNGWTKIRIASSSFSLNSLRRSALFSRISPNSAQHSCSFGMR